jgi:hypothetical protein
VNKYDVILLEIHEDLATFDIVAAMQADGFHSFTAHELTIFYRDAAVAKRFIRDEFIVDDTTSRPLQRVA